MTKLNFLKETKIISFQVLNQHTGMLQIKLFYHTQFNEVFSNV
jgi:hypothetical protein